MSTTVLPSLPGLTWPMRRSPIFNTTKQVNRSGKEVRIANWSTPRYQWLLDFNFIRQGVGGPVGATWTEFSQLEGFFESLKGGWDSFLYTDPDDNNVTGQTIATAVGGSTQNYQLVRTFGGSNTTIYAPNTSLSYAVRDNGVTKTVGTDYTIGTWGGSNPGQIQFTYIPTAGHLITADFSYYWPCRFDDDQISFDKVMAYYYELKKLSFTSIK